MSGGAAHGRAPDGCPCQSHATRIGCLGGSGGRPPAAGHHDRNRVPWATGAGRRTRAMPAAAIPGAVCHAPCARPLAAECRIRRTWPLVPAGRADPCPSRGPLICDAAEPAGWFRGPSRAGWPGERSVVGGRPPPGNRTRAALRENSRVPSFLVLLFLVAAKVAARKAAKQKNASPLHPGPPTR